MEPKNIAVVCMFVAVALALLATAFAFPSSNNSAMERFEDPKPNQGAPELSPGAATGDIGNKAIKLHVIEMFNLLLDRNPSPDEITKYGAMKDKDAVSRHIIEDYSTENAAGATPAPATAPAKKRAVDVKDIGRRLRAIADELDAA